MKYSTQRLPAVAGTPVSMMSPMRPFTAAGSVDGDDGGRGAVDSGVLAGGGLVGCPPPVCSCAAPNAAAARTAAAGTEARMRRRRRILVPAVITAPKSNERGTKRL
ncbi:hypothetical protein GCM10009661_82240 [Catellatospora chokoriensis]|uniref:Uncharacterized protein n=1 Tax=Catellatospora chokoriensis TaxID=310353 RepID=A0A8J3K043_9ACTN|nr:hypothetical protein Cch02nite_77100 [Catellatospora chokoriensis]